MDASDWWCKRCGQPFRSFDVPTLTAECKFVHPDECPPFKMPGVWSEQLGLPDVGPIWKDYPITEAEFLARQVKYGDH